MKSRIRIRAGEGAPLWWSSVGFFLILTSYYIIRPVRDQLSGATGSGALPLFYTGTFVAMLALTPVFGWLVSRFARRRLLVWVYGFFILCLIAFVPAFMAQQQIGARTLGVAFFTWVSVFNLFVVSLFWSLMADLWTSEQARRLFPLIAFAGMIGALTGPPLTRGLVAVIGVAPLLVVSAVLLTLALAVLLGVSAHRTGVRQVDAESAMGGSLWAGVRQAFMQPFVRYMAMLMLLSDGIGTLAYALVADYVKAHVDGRVARLEFYADLDMAINVLGMVLQLTLTRWLLARFGAAWGLVLPALINVALLVAIAVLGTGPLLVFGIGVSLLIVLQVVVRGMQYGMIKPASDALYTRASREARYKGKNFVETTVWRFGDVVVTSGLTGLRALGAGTVVIAGLAAGLSGLAAWIGHRVGDSPDLEREPTPGLDARSPE
ncbi:MAG TPA: translocase [Rhodanobacteraceae bacterium]|nr:translocase [Rhodanobacteraceae bacterium]